MFYFRHFSPQFVHELSSLQYSGPPQTSTCVLTSGYSYELNINFADFWNVCRSFHFLSDVFLVFSFHLWRIFRFFHFISEYLSVFYLVSEYFSIFSFHFWYRYWSYYLFSNIAVGLIIEFLTYMSVLLFIFW